MIVEEDNIPFNNNNSQITENMNLNTDSNRKENKNELNNSKNCVSKKKSSDPACYFKLIIKQFKENNTEESNNKSSNNDEEEFEFLVENKVCIIGRSMRSIYKSNIKSKIENEIYHVKIGSSKFISRRHCKIFWENGDWYIKNLSKVSIYVGNTKLNKSDDPIPLQNITPISSLAFRFYFVKPLMPKTLKFSR